MGDTINGSRTQIDRNTVVDGIAEGIGSTSQKGPPVKISFQSARNFVKKASDALKAAPGLIQSNTGLTPQQQAIGAAVTGISLGAVYYMTHDSNASDSENEQKAD
ncbi:MAG: hypothetical protein ACJARD_000397 [Alphaproteobacteria bacterium]|jgi:hypothetical protein